LCVLVVINLFAHYYLVCTVPPGFVDDPPSPQESGWMWASRRKSASKRQLTGVRWTNELNITKAVITKCRKCGVMRPEVRIYCVHLPVCACGV
jgi:palmitoyltransferase